MGEWVDQVHHKAALVHDQINALQRLAPEANLEFEVAVAPYRKLLEKLYLEELPYARLIDDSDLVIHAEGAATETAEPRISALTGLLEKLRDESRKLAKVVAGFTTADDVDNVDLLLSGIARGSLVIGLRVAPPAPDPTTHSLLPADEPVFLAIRAAIQALSEIPHYITSDGINEELNQRIPDPAVRDASLVALKRLSPSGRMGISRIGISAPGRNESSLEADDRRVLRDAIARPQLKRARNGTFTGEVRELDLDAQRLEIRNVRNIGTIRCILDGLKAESARKWVGRTVKVQGRYESDESGRPRLMQAKRITLVREPKTKRLV